MTAAGNETSLFPRFTGEEYARRYHAVRQAMKDQMSRRPLILGARELFRVHYLSNYLAQSPAGFCSPTVKKRRVSFTFNHQPCAKGVANIKRICRPGTTSEEFIAPPWAIDENAFTIYEACSTRGGKGAGMIDHHSRL